MNMEKTETDQRLKLELHKYDREFPIRISSSRSYDNALSGIFPYHVKVGMEEGQELAGLLSSGQRYENSTDKFYPSFALMMNFNGGGPLGGKVLWLSESAVNMLQKHEDLYEIVINDHTTPKLRWSDE
jgi:hypothetical protein